MQRRKFITSGLLLPTALATAGGSAKAATRTTAPDYRVPGRGAHAGKFKISLKADAIGINSAGADELLDDAIDVGYEAISVPAQWLQGWSMQQKRDFAEKATANNIAWGANSLPVEFRKGEDQFQKELAELPEHAKNLADIGVERIGTWLISSHDDLTYTENMRLHADRLGAAAKILGDQGIKLGLEYLGTTALRQRGRFAFLSSGRELKDLIEQIGLNNVGVILDSYHWYTAQEEKEDLLLWSNEEIVAVDLNDANDQLSLHQQTDVARELPGATGVIDLDTFIATVAETGYDGPIRAEPFSKTLNLMDDRVAMEATYRAMVVAIDKALG